MATIFKKFRTGLTFGFFSFWNYVKDSWEGQDGKFSYRRFSQYIFLVCMIKIAFWPPKSNWEFYVFLCFTGLYVIVAAIMSVEQVLTLLKFTLPVMQGKPADPDPAPEEKKTSDVLVNVTNNKTE